MDLLAHIKCPGKLILSGEHSTVYGKNAVATTIDLFTEVKVFCHEDQTVKLVFDNLNLKTSWHIDKLKQVSAIVPPGGKLCFTEDLITKIQHLLSDVEDETNIRNSCIAFLLLYLGISDISFYSDRKPIHVEVTSKLPSGAGLGSSSSYIVCLCKALFTTFNVKIKDDIFNMWCFEIDKLFHGKPSGVDNTICTFGGAILFAGGNIVEQIDSAELAKITDMQVLLVNTKIPRNTKTMVERVAKRKEKFPTIIEPILDSIGSLTSQVWSALKTNDLSTLPVLFEMNQYLLNCLDVGHETIDLVVDIAKKHSMSAKLTGAGGGGIVFILLENKNEKSLIEEIELHQFPYYKVNLGVGGVCTAV